MEPAAAVLSLSPCAGDCAQRTPEWDCCLGAWSCEPLLACGMVCEQPPPLPAGSECRCEGERCEAVVGPRCEIQVGDAGSCEVGTTEFVCHDFARCFCALVVDQLPDRDVERCLEGLFAIRALETLSDVCFQPGTTMGDVLARAPSWQGVVGVQVPLVGGAACDALPVVNPECNHDADCPGDDVCTEVCDDDCFGYPVPGCCDRGCAPSPAPYVCESAGGARRCAEGDACPPEFVPAADEAWDCACCLAPGCAGLGGLVCAQHPGCRWSPRACDGFCFTPNEGVCE